MTEKQSAPQQLSLGVFLRDESTFENFFIHDSVNTQVVSELRDVANGNSHENLFLWGSHGCGLTHLLHAVCHASSLSNIQFLPVKDILGYDAAEVCSGLGDAELLIVDGVEFISGNKSWEQELFHLYNQMKDRGMSMIFAAHVAPQQLNIQLPDLNSRLLNSLVFRVLGLDDDGKQQALVHRAKLRGIELPDEVASFILTRSSRDTNQLFDVLQQLDEASLQKQRRLTIPFVREVLRF